MIDYDSLILKLDNATDIEKPQREALIELAACILAHYPEARFDTWRGIDNPETVYLKVVTDLEDTELVTDLVIDRVVDLLVEEDVHVGVMSLPTPERNAQIWEETKRHMREAEEARLAAT